MNEVMKSEQQDRELALSNKVSDYLSFLPIDNRLMNALCRCDTPLL